MYQSTMETRVEHTILPIIVNNAIMVVVTSTNVLQNNETRVWWSWKNIFLLGEWVWSGSIQGANQEPNFTPNHCSFYKQ